MKRSIIKSSAAAFLAAALNLQTAHTQAQQFVPIGPNGAVQDPYYTDPYYGQPTYEEPRYEEPQYQFPQDRYPQRFSDQGNMPYLDEDNRLRVAGCSGNDDGRYCVPAPQNYIYDGNIAPGTIIIDTARKRLYLAMEPGVVRRYIIAVGREGAEMTDGDYMVARRAEWPDWHPTENMRAKRNLPKKVPGGVNNPLGSRALYLTTPEGRDDLYRIHGTNEPNSIGTAASSGCFRMLNEDVEELYRLVPDNARVVVMRTEQPGYRPQTQYYAPN